MTRPMPRLLEISRTICARLAFPVRIVRPRFRLNLSAFLFGLYIALATWNVAAETAPTAESLASEGDAAFKANSIDLAEQNWLTAEALTQAQLGTIALAEGNDKQAVLLLERAAPFFDKSEGFAVQLAQAYDQANRSAEAVAYLKSFLTKYPQALDARRTLGEVLAREGQTGDALSEFRRVLRIAPRDRETVFLVASSCLKLKDLPCTKTEFSLLSAIVPGAPTEVLEGRMYRDFSYDQLSWIHLRRALQLDPDIQRAHYYLGTLCVIREGSVDLKQAETEFRRELVHYPTDYLSNLYLGVVLVQEHAYADAIPFLQKASAAVPSSVDAHAYLAQAYFERHSYSEAITAARHAIALTPDASKNHYRIANTHYVLAQSLRSAGQTAEAAKEFALVQKLKGQDNAAARQEMASYLSSDTEARADGDPLPGLQWASLTSSARRADLAATEAQAKQLLANVQYALGNLYISQARFGDALTQLEDVYQSGRDYPGLGRNYGLCLFKMNRVADAESVIKKYLQSSPEDLEAVRVLGQVLFAQKRYAEVVATLWGKHWDDIPTEYILAVSLSQTNDQAGASRVLRELLEEHPKSAELKALLGQAAEQEKNYIDAVRYYQEALSLDPTVPEVEFGLGMIYLRNGEMQKAEQHFRNELVHHPHDTRDEYYLAYALGMQQRYDEAIDILRRTVLQHPDFAEARITLGSDLIAQHKPQEGLEQLLIVEKLQPNDPKLEYQIGVAYRTLGRSTEAKAAFARSVQLRNH